MHKLKSQTEIVRIARGCRRRGKAVVTVNGSFDLLHPGHLALLKAAKRYGDVLVVLLNSDRSVRTYKGPSRPFIPQRDRAAMLAALSQVDYIALFDDLTPVRALAQIRPTVHVNGADWGRGCVEQETVERSGGAVKIVRLKQGYSSSALARRLCALQARPAVRAVFFDRDGTINHNTPEYISRKEDFRFTPFALSALERLSATDYKIIIVTNQSGIGRGYYAAHDMHALHRWLKQECARQGIRIDRIYHCPHLPEDRCTCRKPNIGLVLKAARRFHLALAQSWMIGDSEADVRLGRLTNMRTIKIGARLPRHTMVAPHYYAAHLNDAVSRILHTSS